MQLMTLNGSLKTAIGNLELVSEDNGAKMQQADASLQEAKKAVIKEKERLDKLTKQLVFCMIRAPHDGMAVYARENSRYSSGSEIAEGVTVRERQRLLSLPDTSLMRVKTQIHEAVLDQVRVGLPVIVKIDAFPNRTYKGRVMQVAVVPSSSYYTTVKTYECTVDIEEEVQQLKPGMTAVVDIHIERLKDILAVPVQAVVQIERDTWCYVQTEHGVERCDIELGRTNDKFVEVKKGLKSGWRVILNPMSIIKETEKTEIAPDAGVGETPEIFPASAATDDKGKKGRSEAAKKSGGAWNGGGAGRTGGGGRGAGAGGSNRRPNGGQGGGGRPGGGRPAGGAGD
jgi:HlyD family secretion protein